MAVMPGNSGIYIATLVFGWLVVLTVREWSSRKKLDSEKRAAHGDRFTMMVGICLICAIFWVLTVLNTVFNVG
jgi:hypothetical protein